MPARPATPRRITVRVLGQIDCEGLPAAQAGRLLGQPKRLAMLAYLMLSQRGGTLTRDQVLAVFWPESDAARARNALRQAISFLRSCLGSDAVVSTGTYGLALAPGIDCDAVQFEALLDRNRKEEALALYGGELLRGFHVNDAPEFQHWLDRRRHHFTQRAAKAAWDLSAECESNGESNSAAFWGKRALALSPFSESEVQRLLRLLERVGDLAGALRAYHGLQQTLHEDFGVAPSAETARIIESIRARLEADTGRQSVAASTRRFLTDRRAAERRRAQVRWTRAERRISPDRRAGERRTGRDRRAP